MKKQNLALAFNAAASLLYMTNEIMQGLHQKGIPVYDPVPGGTFVRNYLSSFAGAAAAAFVVQFNLQRQPAVLWKQKEAATEWALGIATVALTTWELTTPRAFDWPDMGFYGIALTLFYALNKNADKVPAPQPAPRVS